uniref:Uncharacterized protein n=1 Tax=Arundo donax TaxID=35708 RepID=A0A0A9ADD7_ARUDO
MLQTIPHKAHRFILLSASKLSAFKKQFSSTMLPQIKKETQYSCGTKNLNLRNRSGEEIATKLMANE